MTNLVETNDFELRLRYFRPARSHPSIVPFGPRFLHCQLADRIAFICAFRVSIRRHVIRTDV